MKRWVRRGFLVVAIALGAFASAPQSWILSAQKLDPLVYTISFPQPASKTFTVNVFDAGCGKLIV